MQKQFKNLSATKTTVLSNTIDSENNTFEKTLDVVVNNLQNFFEKQQKETEALSLTANASRLETEVLKAQVIELQRQNTELQDKLTSTISSLEKVMKYNREYMERRIKDLPFLTAAKNLEAAAKNNK